VKTRTGEKWHPAGLTRIWRSQTCLQQAGLLAAGRPACRGEVTKDDKKYKC